MGEIRSWTVMSNSFRPGYEICGGSLAEAIRAHFGRICRDALPRVGIWRPLRGSAEWVPGILRGRGGVELVIEAVSGGARPVDHAVWIAAAPSDLPTRVIFEQAQQTAAAAQ